MHCFLNDACMQPHPCSYNLDTRHGRTGMMLSGGRGAVESLPEFYGWLSWNYLNLTYCHIFWWVARIFLIFPSICPNFHGFPKFAPPPPCREYAYDRRLEVEIFCFNQVQKRSLFWAGTKTILGYNLQRTAIFREPTAIWTKLLIGPKTNTVWKAFL
jgi:hypothetical protein